MGIGIRFALMHDDELDPSNASCLCYRLAVKRGCIIMVRWIAVRPLRVKVRVVFGRWYECDREIECLQERVGECWNHRSGGSAIVVVDRARGAFVVVGICQVLPSPGVAVIYGQVGSCDRKGRLTMARHVRLADAENDHTHAPLVRAAAGADHSACGIKSADFDVIPTSLRNRKVTGECPVPAGVESIVVQSTTSVVLLCCRTRASMRYQFMFE